VTAGSQPVDDRTAQTLRDLLEFSDMAARLLARGRAAYDADEALRLAAEAVLHRIGEAVARLPEDFVSAHAEVPWRQIKAARNLVAPRYEQVNHGLIWNALEHDLPRNAEQIQRILDAVQ
jgi:uncharacterized protein with HEPN domain